MHGTRIQGRMEELPITTPSMETRLMIQHDIRETVKDYILDKLLPGEDPGELTPSTPLITGGILDSLVTLKLVAFLEEIYSITFEAHELTVDHLNTIDTITSFVSSKL
jgi:acyl carrier protein